MYSTQDPMQRAKVLLGALDKRKDLFNELFTQLEFEMVSFGRIDSVHSDELLRSNIKNIVSLVGRDEKWQRDKKTTTLRHLLSKTLASLRRYSSNVHLKHLITNLANLETQLTLIYVHIQKLENELFSNQFTIEDRNHLLAVYKSRLGLVWSDIANIMNILSVNAKNLVNEQEKLLVSIKNKMPNALVEKIQRGDLLEESEVKALLRDLQMYDYSMPLFWMIMLSISLFGVSFGSGSMLILLLLSIFLAHEKQNDRKIQANKLVALMSADSALKTPQLDRTHYGDEPSPKQFDNEKLDLLGDGFEEEKSSLEDEINREHLRRKI